MFCEKCGKELISGNVCANCGFDQMNKVYVNNTINRCNKSDNIVREVSRKYVIMALAIILGIIAFCAMAYWSSNRVIVVENEHSKAGQSIVRVIHIQAQESINKYPKLC